MRERETEVIARIRAVDEALARRGMSAAASERVRGELARQAAARPLQARLRWWPMAAFAAGAALMAALLLDRSQADLPELAARPADISQPRVPPDVIAPIEPTCAPLAAGLTRLDVGDCRAGDGVHVHAYTPVTLERTGDRIDVRDGELVFEVAPRPGRPLHVLAGAIDIEVVGTRFIVHQRAEAGWVSLLEGRLRVRKADGLLVALEPGQQLEWSTSPPPDAPSPPPGQQLEGPASPPPDAPSPPPGQQLEGPTSPPSDAPSPAPGQQLEGSTSPPPDAPSPAPPRRPAPGPAAAAAPPSADTGLSELLAEVAALRRAGQFQAAAERLRGADASDWSVRSRELVSYEIGSLLERQLGDTVAACQHWHEHRRRFPGGRRDDIIARSITRLGCGAP